jgi:hypothetical protein
MRRAHFLGVNYFALIDFSNSEFGFPTLKFQMAELTTFLRKDPAFSDWTKHSLERVDRLVSTFTTLFWEEPK